MLRKSATTSSSHYYTWYWYFLLSLFLDKQNGIDRNSNLTSLKDISAVSTPDTCCPVTTSVSTADPTVRHGERCGEKSMNDMYACFCSWLVMFGI